jgi:hypothetical protein
MITDATLDQLAAVEKEKFGKLLRDGSDKDVLVNAFAVGFQTAVERVLEMTELKTVA